MFYNHTAYLIVICDNVTNAVKSAAIWSSPEWEQSRCLQDRTYVAYECRGETFADARQRLIQAIETPKSRYGWICEYLRRD